MRVFVKTTFFVLLAVISAQIKLSAQVTVERSKDKVIIAGKPYYIHIVKKGETAYSICRAYNLTVDELNSENPGAGRGIKEGQSLRLPIRAALPADKPQPLTVGQRDESKFSFHTVSKGETVYSISKRYSVKEDDITASNPDVDIRKISVGTVLAIPKLAAQAEVRREEPEKNAEDKKPEQTPSSQQDQDKDQKFIVHKVVRGESLASIAEKYGVTVKDLRKLNRGLTFPRVDDELKIPVNRIEEKPVSEPAVIDSVKIEAPQVTDDDFATTRSVTEIDNLKGKVKVALLLPLYLNENSLRTETDSSKVIKGQRIKKTVNRPEDWIYPGSLPFVELYTGALIAADSLRKIGLDMEMSIFDIREDTVGVTRLIESGKLNDIDLIIGPVFQNNLAIVSKWSSVPVVSPVPLSTGDILKDKSNIFLVNPTLETAQRTIADYVGKFDTCNFVLVRIDSGRYDDRVNRFRDMVTANLSERITPSDVRFREFRFISRSLLKKDSLGRLEKVLVPGMTNIVLIASEDAPVISETVMELHTLSKKYRIKVVGLPGMRNLDNLDPKFYFDLGIELFTPYRIDYNQKDIKFFTSAYRKIFLTEPSELSFAWQGYDIVWYFATGISMNGRKLLNRPWLHNPKLLQTEYIFERDGHDSGFENRKLYLLRYTPEMETVFPLQTMEQEANVNKN
jgi:LysM repeat protein